MYLDTAATLKNKYFNIVDNNIKISGIFWALLMLFYQLKPNIFAQTNIFLSNLMQYYFKIWCLHSWGNWIYKKFKMKI